MMSHKNIDRSLILLLSLLLFGCGSSSVDSATNGDASSRFLTGITASQNLRYVPSAMAFGTVYDSISGIARKDRQCVEVTDFYSEGGTEWIGGINETTGIQIVTTEQQLNQALNVSANASLDIGVYSGSLKSEYTSNVKMTSNKIVAIWSSGALGPVKSMQPAPGETSIKIKDSMLEEFDTWEKFYDYCGDSYISGIRTGSELQMVLEIQTSGTEEMNKISTEITAAAGKAFKGEGSFSSDLSSVLNSSDTTATIIEFGSVDCPFNVPDLTIDQFQQKIKDFSAATAACLLSKDESHPSFYMATISDLKEMWEEQKVRYDEAKLTGQAAAINDLVVLRGSYNTLSADVDYMHNNSDQYDWSDSAYTKESILSLTNIIADLQAKILDIAQACADDSYNCDSIYNARKDELNPLPDDMRKGLPKALQFEAKSCLEYKSHYPNANLADGSYPLYLCGRGYKPIDMYCLGMTTLNPKEYIILDHVSSTSDLQYNYATITNTWHYVSPGVSTYYADVSTVWEKIPVVLHTQNRYVSLDFAAARCDQSIAGVCTTYSDTYSGLAAPLWPRYFGRATGSINGIRKGLSYPGKANINLYNTPFSIQEGVAWSPNRSNTSGNYTISNDRKVAAIAVEGDTGIMDPTVGINFSYDCVSE